MNQSAASDTSRISRWASRQLADYNARTRGVFVLNGYSYFWRRITELGFRTFNLWLRQPGTVFAEGVVLDVAEGSELQPAVAQLRRDRGERMIGCSMNARASR